MRSTFAPFQISIRLGVPWSDAEPSWPSPQEAREFGFECGTSNFDEALAWALGERGADASIAVNRVCAAVTEPPGRPVAWRAMPWREG